MDAKDKLIAQLQADRDALLLLLKNCRNGLELLLTKHKPKRPDDPFDTINELRETVRKSTAAIAQATQKEGA